MRLAKPKTQFPARVLAIAAATCLAMASYPARADVQAEAERLFEQGMKLMQAGKHRDACPKLAESLKLDPALGTRFRLAECYEAIGKTASAWAFFREAAAKASASKLYPQATKANARAEALEPKLAKVILDVPDEVATIRGISITLDDEPLGDTSWRVPLPVDPGKHILRVAAPGKTPQTTEIDVIAATSQTIKIPPFREPTTSSKNAIAGISVLGVGAGALIVGGIFGGMALKLDGAWQNAVDEKCDRATLACQPDAIAGIRRFESERDTYATISTVGIIAGAALAAAGAVVWIAPWQKKGTEVSLAPLGPAGLGATLHGSF